MRNPFMNNKIRTFFLLGLSLLAVGVTSLSTLAWFQLSQVTYDDGQVVGAGTANISSIARIDGYKAIRQRNLSGNLTINGDAVSKQQVGAGIDTSNTGNADVDDTFDIPEDGNGYYILKEQTGGHFSYADSERMISSNYSEQASLEGYTLEAGTKYRFMHYTNTGSTYNQISPVVGVDSEGADVSGTDLLIGESDITGKRIWYNGFNGRVHFETVSSNDYKTANRRIGATKKNAMPGALAASSKRIYCTLPNFQINGGNWGSTIRVHYWGNNIPTDEVSMTEAYTNENNQKVYYADIPSGATGLCFNNGSGWWSQNGTPSGHENADTNYDANTYAWYFTGSNGAYGDDYGKALINSWDFKTVTYYLYNYYEGTSNFFGSTPYFHTWTTNNSSNNYGTFNANTGPDYPMTRVSGDIWKVDLPKYENRSIMFGPGTANLQSSFSGQATGTLVATSSSVDNAGKTFCVTGESNSAYTGEWHDNIPDYSTTYSYGLVDLKSYLGNGVPYIYPHNGTDTTVFVDKQFPGHQMTQPNNGVRYFTISGISSSYTKVTFNCGNNTKETKGKDANNSYFDYPLGASYDGKVFEINSKTDDTHIHGRWTEGPARTTVGGNAWTRTVYLYDPNGRLGNSPKAYFWDDDSSDNYYYATSAFPGVNYTAVQYNDVYQSGVSTTGTSYIYKFTFSKDYTNVIFNDGNEGGTHQTISLDVTSADGKVFECLSTNNGGNIDVAKRSLPNFSNTTTVNLFDAGGFGGLTPYIYAWKNNKSVIGYPQIFGKGPSSSNSVAGSMQYSFEIPAEYDRILFSNGSSSKQTGDIVFNSATLSSSVFVVTEVGAGSHTGKWYASVAQPTGSKTVYLYDPDATLSDAPKIHSWCECYIDKNYNSSSDPAATKGLTFYHPYTIAWDSDPTMTAVTSYKADGTNNEDVTGKGLWSYTTYSQYDRFIFRHKSQSKQTADSIQAGYTAAAPYFILNSSSSSTVSSTTYYGGDWCPGINYAIRRTSYFLYDGTNYTRLTDSKFNPKVIDSIKGQAPNATYSPSDYTSVECISDVANGIFYRFVPETTTWYSDQACTSVHSQSTLTTQATFLYKRMVCDTRDMRTFYVDASRGDATEYHWESVNIYMWNPSNPGAENNANGSDVYSQWQLQKRIYTDFYQLTIPKQMAFRFNLSGSSGGSNETEDVSDVINHEGDILWIHQERFGYNRKCYWGTRLDVDTLGTAEIKITRRNSDVDPYPMGIGNLTNNYFIYENGVEIIEGESLVIEVNNPNTDLAANLNNATTKVGTKYTFDSDNLAASIHGTDADYIVQEGETGYNSTRITISKTGRYTFYLTSSGDIQIAPIPLKGNGYYIMPYAGSTNSFVGATKMTGEKDANDNFTGTAYYNAYVVTEQVKYDEEESESADAGQIYIRSYINGVESSYLTLVKEGRESNSIQAKIDGEGVITIKAGTYNIRVEGTTIYISTMTTDDFFAMDPLMNGLSIEKNYTSIVLEVEFKTVNTLPVKAALQVQSLPSYLGVGFYASETKITSFGGTPSDVAPYEYMRSLYMGKDESGNFKLQDGSSQLVCDEPLGTNDGTNSYFAYIIIDYRVNGGAYLPSHSTTNVHFILKCIQG